MSYLAVNCANIFYESYGSERQDQAPVVLIHGSTGTGASNWRLVASLLARHYRVIVPDCRGHGRSSNPGNSYSFKEMAADIAGLVRQLGYRRAHIVGHSNGGNVALVVLMEHADIVQTAVMQAANAYVSPDLVEKEPPIFDPERVARESPGWRDEMIALHGETHGNDYWRDLLRLTVQEIISEPNYTPAQLAGVQRPTLVIQGENDRVNAPARHAQFIAEHIPLAELWLPAGTGHNVHDERLFEWLERLEDFLARRGNDPAEALHRLKQSKYADERDAIFDVRAVADEAGARLSGRVLTADQLAEARGAAPGLVADDVHVLLDANTPWALVNRSVHNLRREPRSLAERVSQVLMGEAVRLLESRDGWWLVRAERDGYMGWCPATALHVCSEADAGAYQASAGFLVQAELEPAYSSIPDKNIPTPERAGKLPFGITLPVVRQQRGWSCVRLPDERLWWVHSVALLPLAGRPAPDTYGIGFTLGLIQRFIGVPYLWGGRSPFGYDCSGLAQMFWGFMGVSIPRDADQQRSAALEVNGAPQPGDLLFFGEEGGGHRHISHVAISLGGDEMIHANGTAWGVSINSLDPASPKYNAWLHDNLVSVGRPRIEGS